MEVLRKVNFTNLILGKHINTPEDAILSRNFQHKFTLRWNSSIRIGKSRDNS